MPSVLDEITIELRPVANEQAISLDVTRHMSEHLGKGQIIVISSRPTILLAVVRKRWVKLIRDIERKRCGTLNRERKDAFNEQINYMQIARFSSRALPSKDMADIHFIDGTNAAAHLRYLSKCHSIYITEQLPEDELLAITKLLSKNTHIIMYGDWLSGHQKPK